MVKIKTATVTPIKDIMDKPEFENSQLKEKSLPYDQYKTYFVALRDNDVEKVSSMFSKASPVNRNAMLNGAFDFGTDSFIPTSTLSRLSRPLFIATFFASMEVVELMLKEGADLFQENVTKGNILHSLVVGGSFDTVLQDRAVLVYRKLVTILDKPQMTKLLMHENKDGVRPLELAVHLGCLCLYECMQLTPGVYVTKTLEKGVFKEEWIDITEYETYEPGNRRTKSPTFIFAFLDKKLLSSPKDKAILESDLVSLWMDKKMKCNKFVMAFWAFCRILYATLFYVYITKDQSPRGNNDEPSTNGSHNASPSFPTQNRDCANEYMYFKTIPIVSQVMVTYLIVHSVISVMTSGMAYRYFRKDHVHFFQMNLKGKKDSIMDYSFYVVNHVLTNLMYVLGGILALFNLQEIHTLVNILVILTCITSVWSVLYFVQMLPSIGHFAITIQRMVWVLLQFIVVFALAFLPFPHAFYRLLQSKDGCADPNFSPSFPVTIYNTFTILLNMVDLSQYEANLTSGDYVVLLSLHIIYVFVLPILLINFLIALLSSSVAEVNEHKMTVMTIQKLCVISQIERYMLQCGYLRSLWKYLQSKHFHIVDGRYYLIIITLNLHLPEK